MCAGCHKPYRPDRPGAGEFQFGRRLSDRSENGVLIDAAGEINGASKFVGPIGLAQVVHDDPATTNCVASKDFAFATGYLPPDRRSAVEADHAEVCREPL